MNKIYLPGIIVFLLCSLTIGTSKTWAYMGMVTGSKTGTYYQFGSDIADLCRKHGLDILVKESQGSLDNITRMQSRENAAFGIVQSDVLGVLYLKKPEVAEKLGMILPFYNEEVHLIARKGIDSFTDLNQKTIATGTKGSGSWLTLANLLNKMHIQPAREITDLKPMDALIYVLEGKIDAMIYVAGKPVPLFSKMEALYKKPKYRPLIDNVHFVPLNDPDMLKEYYVPSKINVSDYSWVKETTPTIAVKALLVSFDFSACKSSYCQKRCSQLKELSTIIKSNLDLLKKSGHEKWNEVDLEVEIGRWKPDQCSHPYHRENKKEGLYEDLKKMFE